MTITFALKPNQKAVLSNLAAISAWEHHAVQTISQKLGLTTFEAQRPVWETVENTTVQAYALTRGANTEEHRAAILPRLSLEVETLRTYGDELIGELAANIAKKLK